MPIEDFEIVGSYNNQRFPNIDAERTINMFEYLDATAKKPKSLLSTSGLQNTGLIFTGSIGGFRAEYVLNDFEYDVVGQDIWRRDQFNVLDKLNGAGQPIAITDSGYVGVDANNADTGSQILFVDGQKGHVYDTGTGQFTYDIKTVDPGFPSSPVDVCFIDGFLVVAHGGTNQFQLSGFNNAFSWSLVANTFTADSTTNLLTTLTQIPTGMPIQFTQVGTLFTANPAITVGTTYYAIRITSVPPYTIKVATTYANALLGVGVDILTNGTNDNIITNLSSPNLPGQLQQGAINSHPGNIVGCRTLHRRIFFFSENYTEVWENAGIGTNLPIRRNNGLLMEYGTPAIGSIVTGFDKLIFLSQDRDGLGSVMEVVGTESIPISNRALDFQLSQYAELDQISDARGIFIKENGIIFYRLNFTAANHTFVYNDTLSNPASEEGKLWHEEQVLNGDRHPGQTHGYFNGNNFLGSYDQPILYQVDSSFSENDGESIPRIRIGRYYAPSTYNRTRIDRFMLDIIQGLPIVSNVSGILDLLTESGNIINTENDLDILLEGSTFSPIFSDEPSPVFLSYSKDGGVTFGYRQKALMGAIGDRKHRTVWRKLGVVPRGQGFIPKIEFFSKVPFIILGASWFYEVMPE